MAKSRMTLSPDFAIGRTILGHLFKRWYCCGIDTTLHSRNVDGFFNVLGVFHVRYYWMPTFLDTPADGRESLELTFREQPRLITCRFGQFFAMAYTVSYVNCLQFHKSISTTFFQNRFTEHGNHSDTCRLHIRILLARIDTNGLLEEIRNFLSPERNNTKTDYVGVVEGWFDGRNNARKYQRHGVMESLDFESTWGTLYCLPRQTQQGPNSNVNCMCRTGFSLAKSQGDLRVGSSNFFYHDWGSQPVDYNKSRICT